MKVKMNYYNLYLIGHNQKIDDYYYLEQIEGQKIIMALAGQNPPKYILLKDGHIINSTVIKEIICLEEKDYGKEPALVGRPYPQLERELTQLEEETYKKFMMLRGQKDDFLTLN